MSQGPGVRRYDTEVRMVEAAIALLDADGDERVGLYVTRESEGGVLVDWPGLERVLTSFSEITRLEMARSLLDGAPVVLKPLESFDEATYGLVIRALAQAWPAERGTAAYGAEGRTR